MRGTVFLEELCGQLLNEFHFKYRITLDLSLYSPMRAYCHTLGFNDAFDDSSINAITYLNDVLYKNSQLIEDSDYMLATLWGDNSDKMIDLFTFSDTFFWPGNPNVFPYVIKNGVSVSDRQMTCGDTIIMLGQEELYRRKTKSIDHYFSKPPSTQDRKSLQTYQISE